ncbi:MAG TPA: triple tyrosine motif-containing protein, partial [Longimicrobium sp.]
LHLDREGALWVGTDGGGLNRVRRRLFSVLEPTHGRVVQSVCEAGDGSLWIGFASQVGRWQDGGMQAMFGREQGLQFSVRSVFVDSDRHVWAGTLGELFRLREGRFQRMPVSGVPNTLVLAMHEDRARHLWVGAVGGLSRWDGREWTNHASRLGLAADSIRALADDARTNLWIGTESSGLLWLQGEKVTPFRKSADGLPSDNISALWVDGADVLWVGTEGGGLARFHGGRWTRYSTSEGLAGNAISYLIEDGLDQLWIGSSAGLMRVAKKDLNDFAAGRLAAIQCRAYGREEGLPTKECSRGSQPAAWRGRDGRLWFATIQGLASVDPAGIQPNTNPPPVVIEAVRIEGQADEGHLAQHPRARHVTVPARKQRIEIQYTSLNLAAPKRARFKYRLEGHEGGWTDVGDTRTVSFFKLEPGSYRFQVTACNEDGLWNPVPAEVAIAVLPPFWRTWWFLTAVTAALLAAVIAAVHLVFTQRLNRQLATLRQQEALERERARIARDIHDQLGANLTQVALLGELVEADKHSPADIEEHARQISQTARDTTRSLDEIVWTVNPANDTLEGLASYLCKYAQEYLAVAGLRVRLEVPAELPAASITPDVRHNVYLAAREAVTNIVRHAKASSAWLRLKVEPGRFTFEIQDDGRGPGEIESERARTRSGLRNMSRRMEDVGGSFSISPAPGRGTVVRLTAPINAPGAG